MKVNFIILFSIILLALTETFYGTTLILKSDFDKEIVTIVYFVCGILLPFLTLKKIEIDTPSVFKPKKGFFERYEKYLRLDIFICLLLIVWHTPLIIPYFKEVPIDYRLADMIPVLKIQAERFLRGDYVYDIAPIWTGMKPIYLPFMWLPFTISSYFNFDARWIPLFMTLMGVFATFKITPYVKNKFLVFWVVLGFFWAINAWIHVDKNSITKTQEGVVIGFYLFLGYALWRKNPYLIGLAITFCLLSRYLFIFWLPILFFYWFFFQSRKQALIIASISFIITLITFIIPYFIHEYDFFLNQHKGYIAMAESYWEKDRELLTSSLGIAKFLKVGQVTILHNSLIITSLLVPIVFFVVFILLNKYKSVTIDIFPIASLKLTLVCFYNLLEMPYIYLFYTSTFFTYVLLLAWMTKFEYSHKVEAVWESKF